jgi:hypothetical protein
MPRNHLSILHGLVHGLCNEPNLVLRSSLVNDWFEPLQDFAMNEFFHGALDFDVPRASAFANPRLRAPIAMPTHTRLTTEEGHARCHAVFTISKILPMTFKAWYIGLRPSTEPYEIKL